MEWYEELYQTEAWRKESTLARFRLDGKRPSSPAVPVV